MTAASRKPRAGCAAIPGVQFVEWEYRKIVLNDHHRKGDDLDLLCDAGEDGWELVAITPNNVAYLKRRFDSKEVTALTTPHEDAAAHLPPKYRDSQTGDTWSGRGRMASWLKRKQDAGEDIEKYRV